MSEESVSVAMTIKTDKLSASVLILLSCCCRATWEDKVLQGHTDPPGRVFRDLKYVCYCLLPNLIISYDDIALFFTLYVVWFQMK